MSFSSGAVFEPIFVTTIYGHVTACSNARGKLSFFVFLMSALEAIAASASAAVAASAAAAEVVVVVVAVVVVVVVVVAVVVKR